MTDQQPSDQPPAGEYQAPPPTGEYTSEPVAQTEQAGQGVQELGERGRQKAREVREQISGKAQTFASEQQQAVAGHLDHLEVALHEAAQKLRNEGETSLATYGDRAAEGVRNMAQALHNRPTRDIVAQVEDYGRRNPRTFLEMAFMGGLMLGRFLRSTSPEGRESQRDVA